MSDSTSNPASDPGTPASNLSNPNTVDVRLRNDETRTLTVLFRYPAAPGDALNVTSSDPERLEAEATTDPSGRPAILLRPRCEAADGLTVRVRSGTSDEGFDLVVAIVADPAAIAMNPPTAVDDVNFYSDPLAPLHPPAPPPDTPVPASFPTPDRPHAVPQIPSAPLADDLRRAEVSLPEHESAPAGALTSAAPPNPAANQNPDDANLNGYPPDESVPNPPRTYAEQREPAPEARPTEKPPGPEC